MKKTLRTCLCAAFFVLTSTGMLRAQQNYPAISMAPFGDGTRHWYFISDPHNLINAVANQPRYNENEITRIADNILLFQCDNGGWPKNYDMQAVLTPEQVAILNNSKNLTHTTFDNSTTYTHIEYLAKVYQLTKTEKYKAGCERGINFCLKAQYPNGGWPQYYPINKGSYSRHITYNDGAFLGIVKMLVKINSGDSLYAFLNKKMKQKCKVAYNKAIDCILNTQIEDNGRLTVWCQQHDEISLKPAWARAFEPPAICNGESADIVLFLMSVDNPDKRIINAVQSAVKWFDDSKILYTRVMTVKSTPEQSQYRVMKDDKVVVTDSTASPVWTRYYEPVSDRPLFCDRNSKYLYSLAEVSRERRTGYAWYTYAPQNVLNKYAKWQKKWAPNENVLKANKR